MSAGVLQGSSEAPARASLLLTRTQDAQRGAYRQVAPTSSNPPPRTHGPPCHPALRTRLAAVGQARCPSNGLRPLPSTTDRVHMPASSAAHRPSPLTRPLVPISSPPSHDTHDTANIPPPSHPPQPQPVPRIRHAKRRHDVAPQAPRRPEIPQRRLRIARQPVRPPVVADLPFEQIRRHGAAVPIGRVHRDRLEPHTQRQPRRPPRPCPEVPARIRHQLRRLTRLPSDELVTSIRTETPAEHR